MIEPFKPKPEAVNLPSNDATSGDRGMRTQKRGLKAKKIAQSGEMYTQFCRDLASLGVIVVALEHEDAL